MSNTLQTFLDFMADESATTMYITGAAGTGKTTALNELIIACNDSEISYVVCAYTHKAVSVLVDKLPAINNPDNICTLHSFLVKCPTVNVNATKLTHLDNNVVTGNGEYVNVVFIDEFSMVGDRDLADLKKLQLAQDKKTKVVFIGDLHQLPPVKDVCSIKPSGKYWVNLTFIYRQDGNPLLDTLAELVSYIEGAEPYPLAEHSKFVRGVDIVELYRKSTDAKILAFTNERVQELNASVAGKTMCEIGDYVYSPTVKKVGVVDSIINAADIDHITTISGDLLVKNTRYKRLEVVLNLPVVFLCIDEEGSIKTRAVVFGHYNWLALAKKLRQAAVDANKAIAKITDLDPITWCRLNKSSRLSKARNEAWSKLLAFNNCVICVDFNHAMTIHKSQGSTYSNVFIDINDLYLCAKIDYKRYLQLLYVAISRASDCVYTN